MSFKGVPTFIWSIITILLDEIGKFQKSNIFQRNEIQNHNDYDIKEYNIN